MYWNILGIPAGTDVAGIKLAYATKLKSTRPDTNPEQFKQLHYAYKQALAAALNRGVIPESMANEQTTLGNRILSEQEDTDNIKESELIPIASEIQNKADTVAKEQVMQIHELSEAEKHYEMLLRKASEVISEPDKRNNFSEWEFLIESPFILEPWIHARLGIYIFNEIYRVNTEARNGISRTYSKRKRYLAPNAEVRKSTAQYLNDIFHWTAQHEQMRFYTEPGAYKFVFALLPETNSITEQQKALRAVKGSQIVLGSQVKKESALEKHTRQQEALDRVKRVTLNTLVVFIVVLSLLALLMFSEEKIPQASVFFVSAFVAKVFAIFVRKENKYAFYLIWPYATLLLCFFPIGTYAGGILLYNLSLLRNWQG